MKKRLWVPLINLLLFACALGSPQVSTPVPTEAALPAASATSAPTTAPIQTGIPTDAPTALPTQTPTPAPTSMATPVPELPADSCLFFSDGQFAQAEGDIIPVRSAFTVEMWIFDMGDGVHFVEYISQGGNSGPFYLGTTAGSDILRAGDAWIDTGIVMPKESWTHLAIVRNGSRGELYLNGELVSTLNSGFSFGSGGSPTRLGSQFGAPTEFFFGCLDEVKIFNSARTIEQIQQDMLRGIDASDPDLVAYYDFENRSDAFIIAQGAARAGNALTFSQKATWSSIENVVRPLALSSAVGLSICQDGTCGAYIDSGVNLRDGYQLGFGFYATIWPMLTEAPGPNFQMGLGSTWINPDLRGLSQAQIEAVQNVCNGFGAGWGDSQWVLFQTIEGGFGYWVDTQFKSAMPKWRFNATPDCYQTRMRSSPGWPFGGTEALPIDNTGLVHLSNRMLVAPDGQTFPLTTNGEVLGIAWMALPFPVVAANNGPSTTGPNAWTLFVNSANFKGPLAYYMPQFFSGSSQGIPGLAGMGLDSAQGYIGSVASEIGNMPLVETLADDGSVYSAIPQPQFPVDDQGRTVLVRDLIFYSETALATQFSDWLGGSAPEVGMFSPDGALDGTMNANHQPEYFQNNDLIVGLSDLTRVSTFDSGTAFGFQWIDPNSDGLFPVFFHDEGAQRVIVDSDEVPAETGLASFSFANQSAGAASYNAPSDDWWDVAGLSIPGGTVTLTDGSTVTYVWFKFTDQPALRRLNQSEADRQVLQDLVERMHREWPTSADYMAPPASGELVAFDSALLVTPPPGMEFGYVPIAISQTGPVVGSPLP